MNEAEMINSDPSTPRVSVVMAAYNYGQYIAQAIQSVIDQTYTDWELVVVDDGSKDNTRDIVQPFLEDRRIRYFWQENRGQPQTKNRGIGLSRGSLIAFLDADDAWMPTKLDRQVELFDRDPQLGVAYTGRCLIDPDGNRLAVEDRDMVRGLVLRIAIRRTIPPFSSSIVRRSVLDDVGLFDETIQLAIDYELWMRVARKYSFDYVDEPLLLYRTGHANLSRRSDERRALVLDKILPEFLARPGVSDELGNRAIAEAYADTYLNQAHDERSRSLRLALTSHMKAIRAAPWMWPAWYGVIRCCVPDSLVRCIKSPLGKIHRPQPTHIR